MRAGAGLDPVRRADGGNGRVWRAGGVTPEFADGLAPVYPDDRSGGRGGDAAGDGTGADDYLPKPFSVEQLLGAVEARLRKQQTMREQAARQLSVLRSNISLALPHEFLTPLNGVLGFADLLVADAASLRPEEVASMANAIRDSARRLERLTATFFCWRTWRSMRTTGRPGGRMERESLGPGVEEVVRGLAAKADRGPDVTLDLAKWRGSSGGSLVEDHRGACGQRPEILGAGHAGVGSVAPARGFGGLAGDGRGRGMRPEHIAEVGAYMQFERKFYEQQGSGLGLTLARRLAELQGGRLAITSKLGVGTVVEVTLPRADRSLASPML
jgi:two-component system, sensor histidine kinase and response regulator